LRLTQNLIPRGLIPPAARHALHLLPAVDDKHLIGKSGKGVGIKAVGAGAPRLASAYRRRFFSCRAGVFTPALRQDVPQIMRLAAVIHPDSCKRELYAARWADTHLICAFDRRHPILVLAACAPMRERALQVLLSQFAVALPGLLCQHLRLLAE